MISSEIFLTITLIAGLSYISARSSIDDESPAELPFVTDSEGSHQPSEESSNESGLDNGFMKITKYVPQFHIGDPNAPAVSASDLLSGPMTENGPYGMKGKWHNGGFIPKDVLERISNIVKQGYYGNVMPENEE
ncbi:hypothetical protein Ddc_04569 [Ditylenchus destructor]|nr:hypothetical protein Ddc_04569 [Ditylenchus destructor]